MNALFSILLWFSHLFGFGGNATETAAIAPQNDARFEIQADPLGVHIINVNPRTVEALEDTHFRPNN